MRHSNITKQIARFLAYVLERRPDEFGLVPDPDGFIKIKELLKAVCEEPGWKHIRRSHIDEILITQPDPPFEIQDIHIRAIQRGKIPARALAENPPRLLYTCVRRKAHAVVLAKGITPLGRRHVILCADRGLAEKIGRRIDPAPIVLTVNVQQAKDQQVLFYQAGDLIYLAESIPAGCFTAPPLPKEKQESNRRVTPAEESSRLMPGSFIMKIDPDKAHGKESGRKPGEDQDMSRKKERKRQRKPKRERQPPPWRS